MGRLRGKHQRVFGARAVATNRMHVFVHGVETGVRQPGFIKVQGVNFRAQHLFDHFHVVQNTIVGALRDRQNAGLLVLGFAGKRMVCNFLGNALGLEFLKRNWTNNAQMIARGCQEHGNGTGHGDRMQNRFVTVAVYHHDIAGCHVGMPHHFVGSRCSVGHKETVVCIENTRRVAFRSCNRTGVVQQLTQFIYSVTHVGTQHVFTKKLVEHLPNRAF